MFSLLQGEKTRMLMSAPVRKVLLPILSATRLAYYTDNLVFFTPAPLFLGCLLDDRVLGDFLSEYGQDVVFYHRRFAYPIFRGLDAGMDSSWNHILWAVKKAHWPAFEAFLCSAVFTDSERQRVFAVGRQSFVIADPLFMESGGLYHKAPVVPLTSFGIDGSEAAWGFQIDPALPWSMPVYRRFPPREERVAFARAYYQGIDPLKATDIDPAQAIKHRIL